MCAEGVATLDEQLLILNADNASSICALLDPFRPFDYNEYGRNSINLFRALSAKGVKAALWYGFDSLAGNISDTYATSRAGRHEQMQNLLNIKEDDTASPDKLWCSEIYLEEIGQLQFRVNPGVLGCGFVCASMSIESIRACELLAMGLVSIYQNARLPDGSSGALQFETIQF